MSTSYYHELPSPVGPLTLVSDGEHITAVHLRAFAELAPPAARTWIASEAHLREARRQLEAYFAGTLREFDLPLLPSGTAFQQRVWAALREIPYGGTASYGEIAQRVGAPGSARAVGAANGQNPIAILIPCHRVIGANGALVGYGGGLPRKSWLLAHERRVAAAQLTLV